MTALRVALSARTGAVVDLVRGRLTEEVLQLVSDALIAAVGNHIDGAYEVAAECAAALRVRDWTGDDLADQPEAVLGMSATPMLRPLAVDLEELSSLLEVEVAYGGGRIDLQTGQTWPTMIADVRRITRGLSRHGVVHRLGRDPAVADRLDIAISGRGACTGMARGRGLPRTTSAPPRGGELTAQRPAGAVSRVRADRGAGRHLARSSHVRGGKRTGNRSSSGWSEGLLFSPAAARGPRMPRGPRELLPISSSRRRRSRWP